MRSAHGYAVVLHPDEAPREADTFRCAHCQRVVMVRPSAPASESGGWCSRCAAPVCGPCADAGKCDPFEKKLERAERRGQLLRAMGVT